MRTSRVLVRFGRGLPEQHYNVAAPYAHLRIIRRLNGVYLIGLLQ
jgi:hypothetical protein